MSNTGTSELQVVIPNKEERKKMVRVVPFKKDEIEFSYDKLDLEPIPLGSGTRIEVQLADVQIEHLRLDRTNPRLRYKLESRHMTNPSQKELAELLWEDEDVKLLKRSIQHTGGLIEAVIIKGSDGTVLEGNCRTACYMKLGEEFPEEELWKKVRARIVPPGVDRIQIDILLGELHIAGKNEWKPFEQAAHLYEMNQVRGISEKELADTYRMSKSSVNKKIRAYKLMSEKYLPHTSEGSPLEKWSYFEEFYKGVKPKNNEEGRQQEEDFVGWMIEGKFDRGEQVRWLPKILEDEAAKKSLESSNVQAAWEIVQTSSPEFGSKLFKAVVAATDALKEAPLTEVHAVKAGDKARLEQLRALSGALDEFIKQTGRKL